MSTARCAWCGGEAVTDVNLGKGRKLQLVKVCSTHRDMVERERGEREREAQKKKEPFRPWW